MTKKIESRRWIFIRFNSAICRYFGISAFWGPPYIRNASSSPIVCARFIKPESVARVNPKAGLLSLSTVKTGNVSWRRKSDSGQSQQYCGRWEDSEIRCWCWSLRMDLPRCYAAERDESPLILISPHRRQITRWVDCRRNRCAAIFYDSWRFPGLTVTDLDAFLRVTRDTKHL